MQTKKINWNNLLKWKPKIKYAVFINYVFYNGYSIHVENPPTEEEWEKMKNEPLAE